MKRNPIGFSFPPPRKTLTRPRTVRTFIDIIWAAPVPQTAPPLYTQVDAWGFDDTAAGSTTTGLNQDRYQGSQICTAVLDHPDGRGVSFLPAARVEGLPGLSGLWRGPVQGVGVLHARIFLGLLLARIAVPREALSQRGQMET